MDNNPKKNTPNTGTSNSYNDAGYDAGPSSASSSLSSLSSPPTPSPSLSNNQSPKRDDATPNSLGPEGKDLEKNPRFIKRKRTTEDLEDGRTNDMGLNFFSDIPIPASTDDNLRALMSRLAVNPKSSDKRQRTEKKEGEGKKTQKRPKSKKPKKPKRPKPKKSKRRKRKTRGRPRK